MALSATGPGNGKNLILSVSVRAWDPRSAPPPSSSETGTTDEAYVLTRQKALLPSREACLKDSMWDHPKKLRKVFAPLTVLSHGHRALLGFGVSQECTETACSQDTGLALLPPPPPALQKQNFLLNIST